MPDSEFGELIGFSDVEDTVLLHYRTWMHTWLCARERKLNLRINTISRPRSYIVKQTFTALPGEESTPLVIAVSDGFASEPERRGSGDWCAYLRFGIAVMCSGGPEGSARAMCGHYQTAIVGIATRHRSLDDGAVQFEDFNNLRIEDVDEEAIGRSLCAVRMEVVYKVPNFSGESPAPLQPPDNPEDPQPDDPEVQDVLITVNNYLVDEEIPSGP